METVTNKTLEKLKYDLVRTGLVPYETLEQAGDIADAQNINIVICKNFSNRRNNSNAVFANNSYN